ncbi:MAG: AAA family ATPase, partial [Gammaproteobacteria bacterium]
LLIYGNPGVGKTQLARVVAQDIGLSLYEVATTGTEAEALNGERRLRAFALGQRVLERNPDTLIVFDEAEDVFGGRDPFFALFATKPGGLTKAAINRLLEENPVPTLWLTNSIDLMDPAYLRRFQYVLELRGGTRGTRTKSFAKHLAGLPVSQACIRTLAENQALAPAVVANAAAVLRRLAIQDEAQADAALRRVVEHTLEAMGLPSKPITLTSSPTRYELEYSNPDTDLAELLSGLRRRPQARLCLYGPAGTGKTAFGRYLAEQLDKPLLVRRASDLLSMWVGMSEKHIAAMFRDAEREGAVLLLDETDSFLRERSGAHASWEVTQVNELLTQMETFEGLFIASTNLMDTLDAASLRRFDFKIRFNYLNPLQAEKLFRSVLDAQGSGAIPAEVMTRLIKLGTLTPGDFAVVVRKARVYGLSLSAERLIQGLEQECRFKERDTSRPVGFTADLK